MKHTFCLLFVLVAASAEAQSAGPTNLAHSATATASEDYQGMMPAQAVDGSRGSRWSAIPGHNQGVWFQLNWPRPVRVGEVVIRQYDRFVMELDVQTWENATASWRTIRHFGRAGIRLPRTVVCAFAPLDTRRIRICNITNGPSFTEVEVYEQSAPPVIRAASDLQGRFIGIVTDRWGGSPQAGSNVTISGRSRGRAWSCSAATDEHGMFGAPMPVGLTGDVRFETTGPDVPGASAQLLLNSADFQFGLTPKSASDMSIRLDGRWKFMPDPPSGFQIPGFDDRAWPSIEVPSHWEMKGFRPRTGVGGYRRWFSPPSGAGRIKVRFEGVYSGAEVWINGRLVARHEGGATPFEADITEVASGTRNLLAVRAVEHTVTSDSLDKMSQYADFSLGGIMRSVRLFRVPAVHAAAYTQSTRFERGYRDAVVSGTVCVVNEASVPFQGSVTVRLRGASERASVGEMVSGRQSIAISAWSRAEQSFSFKVADARKWEAEHPRLCELQIEIRHNGRVVDRLDQKIGLRQTEINGPFILINGVPVKFRGTCHHDTHPTMGRAVTPELTRRDLMLMKEANLNAVRTSHYPPIPELLDIADELGLYVEDEASFCWVGVSDDLANTPRILQLTAELLARDRNHPSVFMWSLCNESQFGFGFERSHEWVNRTDPSRPTGAATSAWTEIATLHNPISITRIDENEKLDKPLLFDESLCIFQGIFGDVAEMWVDPGIRDYYAVPLAGVYDRFMRSRATRGSMIWCWADDIFCVPNRGLEYGRETARSHFLETAYVLPGRGLVGDAPWGVVDGWRRKKPEFWITKKLHSPVKVPETCLQVPRTGEPIVVSVRNEYDFTNLAELSITWRLGQETGPAPASVPPQSAGDIRIVPHQRIMAGEVLELRFTDRAGQVVDEYRLSFGRRNPQDPKVRYARPEPLRLFEESMLAGDSIHIAGGDFELAFDKSTGFLRRCVAFGCPLLLDLPALHILPSNSPLSPLPNRPSWRLRKLETSREGESIRVKIEGIYDDFEGGCDLLITPAGEVSMHSRFKYTGNDIWAREVGISASVPRDCGQLEWERDADWSVYPSDHIGRPYGSALAFAPHANEVPPGCSWSLDNSPLGTNDFRSTKRKIRWAALGSPNSAALLVRSDGGQSVRAMVETDRISLHINDWFGGTNAGWWEWESNYGKGRLIRKGDVIASTVRLQLVCRSPQRTAANKR